MHQAFEKASKKIYDAKAFTPKMIKEPEMIGLIDELYNVLSESVHYATGEQADQQLVQVLDDASYAFAGFKTYHQMNEVSYTIKESDGGIVPFSKFREETLKIDNKYNEAYLQTEYQLFAESSRMAQKWAEIEGDGDRYNLQYRTAGDEKVRAEHAALNGTTLPQSDPFWESYYPPNGYNCRCTVTQVRKGKYELSDSATAIKIGNKMTEGKQAIFRFNPGKTKTPYPKSHPYMPTGCGDCNKAELAYGATKPACKACLVINELKKKKSRAEIREHFKELYKGKEKKIEVNNSEIKTLSISYQDIKNITGKPHKYATARNYATYKIESIAKKAKYVGSADDKKPTAQGHATVVKWHYLEFDLSQEKSYLVIKEFDTGKFKPHSIQDMDHFDITPIKNRTK